MKEVTKIYLWVKDEGYMPFEITDTKELSKRGIEIGCGAKIGPSAKIGSSAEIGPSAEIGSSAQIGPRAEIGSSAKIGDSAIVKTLFITGSRHSVSYWGEDKIEIGCHQYSISEWLERYDNIGRQNDYAEEEINEYLGYINLIKLFHERQAN